MHAHQSEIGKGGHSEVVGNFQVIGPSVTCQIPLCPYFMLKLILLTPPSEKKWFASNLCSSRDNWTYSFVIIFHQNLIWPFWRIFVLIFSLIFNIGDMLFHCSLIDLFGSSSFQNLGSDWIYFISYWTTPQRKKLWSAPPHLKWTGDQQFLKV